ncbi:hypothetical protein EV178_005324 [Coemansia sp. RSA 1646]|nr:hypothetical protein EV178_005324 [Coemansia sp. RSA 1646]KAJ2211084.1 hypothetical protein EV179_005773 [Coemansia sp. RSA 487]
MRSVCSVRKTINTQRKKIHTQYCCAHRVGLSTADIEQRSTLPKRTKWLHMLRVRHSPAPVQHGDACQTCAWPTQAPPLSHGLALPCPLPCPANCIAFCDFCQCTASTKVIWTPTAALSATQTLRRAYFVALGMYTRQTHEVHERKSQQEHAGHMQTMAGKSSAHSQVKCTQKEKQQTANALVIRHYYVLKRRKILIF